jgi:hypothetical protein
MEVGAVSIQDRPGGAPGAPVDYPGRIRSRRAVLLGVAVVCSAVACGAAFVLSSGGSAGASPSEGGDASSSSDGTSEATEFSTSAVVGQGFTLLGREKLVSKCIPTGSGGAGGNFYMVGIVETSSSSSQNICVSMLQGRTRMWETQPVPLDGYSYQDARDLLKVAPSGGFVLLGGRESKPSAVPGNLDDRNWAALVDKTGKMVWKVPSAVPLLVTDTASYLASGSQVLKVANSAGAVPVKQPVTIPSDLNVLDYGLPIFAVERAAPAEPVFFGYNRSTERLTRLGQSAGVPANFFLGIASNPTRFYVYNYSRPGVTNGETTLLGFDTSAAAFKVDFSLRVKSMATELAVSTGNVYAATCGFAKESTTGYVGDVPLFVQRIHLATKTVAYYEIARPSSLLTSTSMGCGVNGLNVNDSGEVVVGTDQTKTRFLTPTVVNAVIYRLTGTSSATKLTLAASVTADKVGSVVRGPIKVKGTRPAQYTISTLDNTIVAYQDQASALRR